jgi:class 3 adenylate cyclase/tetratricopeptide (TPR) repeat protein/regulation of enolase protein 1 (concanavalin A-like superfamily)
MQCPKCKHENREGRKFCAKCGAKMGWVCPRCGLENEADELFCGECGAKFGESRPLIQPTIPKLGDMKDRLYIPEPLRKRMDSAMQEMEGENRLITALFADISGFTQLSQELSPEDTVEKVNQCFQAITDAIYRYEGSINRFIGDCVLAFFGAPLAHEDDPYRAVMSGLDMINAVSQLGLNIKVGINTGMMYFGPIGTQEHSEISAYGEDINLAKRLQESAQPGQVIIGEKTYRFTRKAFELESLPPLELRGIRKPVSAYLAIRQLPKPEKIRGIEGLRSEMIGRDEELSKLKEALNEVLHGRGQMVSIIGEAGVGKSRLVSELKKLAISNDNAPIWLEGRCLSLGVTASYWAFIDIFREYFRWGTDESDTTRAESIVSCLNEMVSNGYLTEDRYDEIGPMLGNLLSVRFGNDWDDRLKTADPQQIKHRTFMAVRDFFIALAKRQPVILVLEDLHWADSLSLDLISLLMEALTLAPLFLLCVYRPEKEHKSWHLGTIASQKCSERYTEIHLRELTHQQSQRLIESLLRIEDLPESVKEMILSKSQGNPFFVEEVIRSLIEMGMVYREGDKWFARKGIESIAVPESIQSVILSRIDRLEDELRHILQSASVIGRLFRRSLLERVTEQESELEHDLWDLEDHELIYQERIVPEEEYSFKHAFTQETVYGSILSRRRSLFHQQVAEAMELLYGDSLSKYYEQLAYHYDRSNSAEKAVEYLLKAGEKSQKAYLNDDAISYFQRALERLDTPKLGKSRKDLKLSALKGLGQVYHGIGKLSEAEDLLRKAIALGREIGLSVRELVGIYFYLGEVLYWQSRYDDAIHIGEDGLMLLGNDIESVESAMMNSIVAVNSWEKGNHEKYREFNLKNVQFIQHLPYSAELRAAYSHIADMYARYENFEDAMKWVQALRQNAEQHHDLNGLANAHLIISYGISPRKGDFRDGISHIQCGIEILTKIGDIKEMGSSLMVMGYFFFTLGDFQEAEECIHRGFEIAESVNHKRDIGVLYIYVGNLLLCQDSFEKAIEAYQKGIQILREIGSQFDKWASFNLSRAYLASGKHQEALKQFQETTNHDLGGTLGWLEEIYIPEEFQSFCRRFREEHPDAGGSQFIQWFLEPTKTKDFPKRLFLDDFMESLSSSWSWNDLFGDCSYTINNGLEIHAANGRDLQYLNLGAPKILRLAKGNFAIQTVCVPESEDEPAIGGILIWKDKENYLRLDKGIRGKYEINFSGCINNTNSYFGRGRLVSDRIFLRLERINNTVNALCSADGEEWFTVGHVEFPVDDPVEVGLFAIGMIDRTIYHGAFPDGTAIRFESFELWG